jgi:hypothetical protein
VSSWANQLQRVGVQSIQPLQAWSSRHLCISVFRNLFFTRCTL